MLYDSLILVSRPDKEVLFKNLTPDLYTACLILLTPAPPTIILGIFPLDSKISPINLFAEPRFSVSVTDITRMSGSTFFAKEITESEGTEGAILKMRYPLLTRKDSMTVQPKLCYSPSGVHNKILLGSVDNKCTRPKAF